jgi:erythronate-4-phosphate dehydrogenase
MISVVADHKIPFLKGALEKVASVNYIPGGEISRGDLTRADALITRTRTRCDRELLEGTAVRFIASATIGHDHIDTDYCRRAGIRWTNAPGCNASSVEQYMVSALLYLASEKGLDLERSTLGVLGVGNVGSRVARAAGSLGMRTLLNDPPRVRKEGKGAFVDLDELIACSDVITLHVPLTIGGVDNTLGMVNRRFIDRVRKGAVLINTSRGGVVNEDDLIHGISSGRLSTVILDVFRGEPVVDRRLLDLVTLATPHIAGYSLDGKANGTGMAVRALSTHFQLGMDHWKPEYLDLPGKTTLYGDTTALPRNKLLWQLFRETYDITADDRRLREDPGTFESLRGDYPLRREPHVYSVRLFQGDPGLRETLESLGFSVLSDHCV